MEKILNSWSSTNELVRKLIGISTGGPTTLKIAGVTVIATPLRKVGCVLVKTTA